MSKVITVFGATGKQGGSVVKAILGHPQLSKTYSIRAVTRDVTKPAALALKAQGAEVVAANLDDMQSVVDAIKGSSAVFGVTNFWEKMSPDVEIAQGKNLADASKEAKVERFIWSSLPAVSKESHGKLTSVTHFDSKAEVEAYIRSIGVPGSYVMPGPFMGDMIKSIRRGEDGTYSMNLPFDLDKTQLPLVDPVTDIGLFVGAVLLDLPGTLNMRLPASGGMITPRELVKDYESVTGNKVTLNKITYEQFHSFLPPAAADELTGNFQLIEDPGYYVGEPADAVQKAIDLVVKTGIGKPTTWKEFVIKTTQKS